MAKSVYDLFAILAPVSLPQGLSQMVLARIEKEQIRRVKISLFVFGLIGILSLVSLVAISIYFVQTLVQSGFSDYLSLIISDSQLMLGLWQIMALSLTESLPIISLILALILALVFVWSTAKAIVNAKSILLVV